MATLSPKAEQKLKELGKTLSPQARRKLATYDEDEQVKWIVNPLVQFLVQKITNQYLERFSSSAISSNKPVPNQPSPSPSPIDPETTSEEEDVIFTDLFGEEEEEEQPKKKKKKKVNEEEEEKEDDGNGLGSLFGDDDEDY